MSQKKKYTRRDVIKAGTAAAGAATVAPALFSRTALAQAAPGDKPALVVVYLRGGYNAIFGAANAYASNGAFGTAGNTRLDLGNGLVVDRETFGRFSDFGKANMASVGIQHGSNNHGNAVRLVMQDGGVYYAHALAAAMGGDGVIKYAGVNARGAHFNGNSAAINGVSPETIRDFENTAATLVGDKDPASILRARIQRVGVGKAGEISRDQLAMNASSLISAGNGYQTGVNILRRQAMAEPLDVNAIRQAYGVRDNNINSNMANQMAAAEMMVRAGTNVVVTSQGGWDTHGDTNGDRVRRQMNNNMPALSTFVDRMINSQGRNVVLAIVGDFNRTIGNSGHGRGLVATVIGNGVQQGTTANLSNNSPLASVTPGPAGFWGYLGELLGASSDFMGKYPNPHKSIIKG